MIGAAAASPPAAFATVMAQPLKLEAVVPHDPVPMVPVTTLKEVDGSVPSALTVTGVAPATLQPAEPVAVVRHSMMYTESLGVKPVPVTVAVWPLFNPLAGVTVNYGPVVVEAKVIVASVTSVPVVVPIAMAQVASAAEVPQVPFPMVPVWT